MPLTAAITGFHMRLTRGPIVSPGSSYVYGSHFTSNGMVLRSLPVQNALSPAPVSTTHRTSSFERSACHSCASSSIIM